MSGNFGDLDNDGWLDFYLGTGGPDYRALVPNRMFRNADGNAFQDVTTSGGFGHLQKGAAIAFGDVNNDGAQDVYSVLGGEVPGDRFQRALFVNPGTTNRWIIVRLEGVVSNLAIGLVSK
ncbi:MAG: VCBS repeat-containing protein [Bryobacteraceae bacterium]